MLGAACALGLAAFTLSFGCRRDGEANGDAPGERATASAPSQTPAKTIRGGLSSPAKTSELEQILKGPPSDADSENRSEALVSWVKGFSEDARKEALRLLLSTNNIAGGTELRNALLANWAAADPAGAGAWLKSLPGSLGRREAFRVLATSWADQDLDAALAWAQELGSSADREPALAAIAYAAISEDPVKSLEIGVELEPTATREELLTQAAAEWAVQDPSAAADWAKRVDSAHGRAVLIAAVAAAWSESDPESAGRLASQELPSGRAQEDAVIGILQRWAQSAPEAALAWVGQFADGDLKDTALQATIQIWASQDPVVAGEWLNGAGTALAKRDLALSAYAEQIATKDPQAAAAWVEKIEDQQLREARQEALASVWLGMDEESARKWVRSSSLSPQTKDRILAPKETDRAPKGSN